MRFKKIDLTPEQIKRLKEKTLDALEFHMGVLSYSLDDVRISRATFDEWYKTDDVFRASVQEINERTIDFVERKLIENINKNDQRAIEFYLKKKAKSRGYGDDFAEGLKDDEKILGWVVQPVKSQAIKLNEENETDN